ncbi:MAG: HDOD domain-containing protein [Pseudomonadota bacterium]
MTSELYRATAASASSPASAEQTLALLWAQVRTRGDLPGFSKAVATIVAAMQGDNDSEFNMTRAVLADPALTQRVLRLANSAMYSVFGQDINTVSKAVIVLGTESIGHLALGLKLVESLSQASADALDTRGEMEKALLAGHIARQVASAATMRDGEEAVVCSMLHSLGRMMVAFYLTQPWRAIQTRVAQGEAEPAVADIVLGMSFSAIGRAVAQQWGLPAPLVETLQDVKPRDITEPLDHAEWLAAVSTLSTHCASAAWTAGGDITDVDAGNAIANLSSDYAAMLGLEPQSLADAVQAGRASAVTEAGPLSTLGLEQSPKPSTPNAPKTAALPILNGKPLDAAQRLLRGVTDMRGVAATASTVQLLSMALETVFQGLGFSRTIAFLRDTNAAKYVPRLTLGEGVQEILAQLAFEDAYQPDVFHAALANDKMIFIENAQDSAFTNKLPRWWKKALPTARSFMVLPLTVNGHPIGLIYGDWDKSLPHAKIDHADIVPLDQLRTLMVRAIEQRRKTDPEWGNKKL